MAKLRHLALVVKDLEASARFYETLFEMTRAYTAEGTAIYLSDGVMNLALLDFNAMNRDSRPTADGIAGIHHFGFKVDDLAAAEDAIKAAGGTYCYDVGDRASLNFERKFRDLEGIIFDVSEKGWYGALDEETP